MTRSPHNSRKPRLQSSQRRLILWLVLIVVVFSVGLTIGFFRTEPPPPGKVTAPAATAEEARNVVLYFASADGSSLKAESRDLKACKEDDECVLDTVKELVAGPNDTTLIPIFPPQVQVNGVSVDGSLVKVDFSQELISAHPGGTQSELLTAYGLADTLSVNFPHLRQVEIHVAGVPVETLKGHIDLRRPIVPDFTLVEEGAVPIGFTEDQPVERSE